MTGWLGKKKVKDAFPFADLQFELGEYVILDRNDDDAELGHGATPPDAWHDAAVNICQKGDAA